MIDTTIQQIRQGHDVSMDTMAAVIDTVMRGDAGEAQLADLLTALHEKGETVDEIAGAAAALRRHMTPISSTRTLLVDTCGTGGDRSGTFNISTAAALVIAAMGVGVAKHGNRSVTSKSGSADVLAELGVNIDADIPTVERCLDELGICFCFAPRLHPSMKHVAPVRRALGIPTIFNLLGPLSNPAGAPYQLLGVGHPSLRPTLAAALGRLGTRRAAVVSGTDGLDEVTITGKTNVSLVTAAGCRDTSWSPEQFGVKRAALDSLTVDGPAASAQLIRDVLAGHPGPARDIVVINAAAALWTAGQEDDLTTAADRARAALDSGRAAALLEQFIKVSHTS